MPQGPADQAVTVVSGLPRSGTSLMMSMLAAGGLPALTDRVRAADEDNPRGYYEHEAVKRLAADASWLDGARGHAVKIVLPLLTHLPAGVPCRVLLMRRSLDEVLASQAAMLARAGRRGARLTPDHLRRLYEAEERSAEEWLGARPETAWMRVSYNDLVREPGPVVRAVCELLGGGLDAAVMEGAIDPALYRQRGAGTQASEGQRR